MPIPDFNQHGLLPEGTYDCTWDELVDRFCRFQRSDRRPQLCRQLTRMIDELRRANIFREVLVNGSFVTAQAEPNDIDLILVLPANWDFAADLTPDVYNLFSKNRVRKRFGFDIFIVREKSFEYETDLDFLQQVRQPPGGRKGLLRLRL